MQNQVEILIGKQIEDEVHALNQIVEQGNVWSDEDIYVSMLRLAEYVQGQHSSLAGIPIDAESLAHKALGDFHVVFNQKMDDLLRQSLTQGFSKAAAEILSLPAAEAPQEDPTGNSFREQVVKEVWLWHEQGSHCRDDAAAPLQRLAESMLAERPWVSVDIDALVNKAHQNLDQQLWRLQTEELAKAFTQSLYDALEELSPSISEEQGEAYSLAVFREVNGLSEQARETGFAPFEDIRSAVARLSAEALYILQPAPPFPDKEFAEFAFNYFLQRYDADWKKQTHETLRQSILHAVKHFGTSKFPITSFFGSSNDIDPEYLEKLPDNPQEYIYWTAAKIYQWGQFTVGAHKNAILHHIRLLNDLMYPLYKTREEFEGILNKGLQESPDIKKWELDKFDEEISQLPTQDSESIAQLAHNRREEFISRRTDEIFFSLQESLHKITTRAIAADIILASQYTQYLRAKWAGAPDDVAEQARPTKAALEKNVTSWLVEMLTVDFIARDGRGRKPKPLPEEAEKHEWTEKVINACMQAKIKTAANVAKILDLGGDSIASRERALERKLNPLGLSFSGLKIEAEIRRRRATEK